ncbi:MAG: 2-C-methyl-D-erythritol 4-phosphate cytidylyltransferase [Deltaproteobacteria bacterium]|nr:2-C-methyl-D-erythritol 4-phosphate cytidylyltransferase [Deltaproteobacteria bacterium]
MQKVWAIIVAAGQGQRMEDPVRKQYHEVAGLPVITHTLRVFDTCAVIDEIVLCVPGQDIDFCREELIKPAKLKKNIALAAGGDTRQESVFNGLQAIESNIGIIVIHDGVRPFITHAQITACVEGAAIHGACILGIPAFDTLKRVKANDSIIETVNREGIWMAQTPQAFQLDLIMRAHRHARQKGHRATDDASLLEHMGIEVKIIPGSRNNLKITDQDDLQMARTLLKSGFKTSYQT